MLPPHRAWVVESTIVMTAWVYVSIQVSLDYKITGPTAKLLVRILPYYPQHNVVLLLISLLSGVRLAIVTIVFSFVFSFLTLLSHYVLYPTHANVCCCSPFSSHSFQTSLKAGHPLHSRSSSPPFSLRFLSI